MALIAWFPFNETLKNQGCGHMSSDLTLSSPIYENGKNGKNLVLNSVHPGTRTYEEIKNKNSLSCCFWFKTPTTEEHVITQWSDVVCFAVRKISTGNIGNFRLECSNKTNNWFNWFGNGYLTDSSGTGGFGVTAGTWNHTAMSIDGEKIKIYLNGELVNTFNIDSSFVGDFEFTGDFRVGDTGGMYASYTDVRIYDNIITQKEVKEISKGLFAHYKMENAGGNKNYIVDSYFSKKTNTGLFTFCGNEVICQASEFNLSGNSFGVSLDSNIKTEIKGKTITFSMDYKVEETLTYGTTNPWVGFEASLTYSDSTKQWCKWYGTTTIPTIISDGWMHHSETHNIENKEITSIGLNIYFRDTKGKIKFRNPKIEIGNTDTPWIPNPADQLYQSYKKEAGLDKSGYNYNGTIYGELVYNAESPRYKNSTKMDAGYLHYLPSPLNADSEAFTFTCWFYPTKNQTMALYNDRTAQGEGLAIFYLGGGIRFDTGSSANFQSGSITVNTWNFIACTFDKINNLKKTYINGVLAGTAQNLGTLEYIGVNASIGNSSTNGAAGAGNQIYGMLSDVRIYGTALSANDILTIYKNSGIIDNERDIYTYDFNEKDNLIAEMDCPTSATSFQDTFTSAVIDDPTAPTGKALKLICTAQGTSTSSRGYYLSGGAAAWTRAKTKMISGEKYKLSMYVKMNKITDNFLMCIECASKQAQQVFDVGTTYRKIESTFTYDSSTQYSAITNYGKIFDVDDEVYISDLKVEKVNSQFNISKQGIWSQDFIETENDFPYNEYDKIEYIESPGDCYIDTLYIANKDTGIELDFQYTAMTKQNRLLGTYADSNVTGLFCYCLYINGSSQWAYVYNNEKGNWIGISTYDLNRHLLRFNYRNHHYVLDNFAVTREITGSNTNTNTDIALSMPLMAGKIVTSSSQSITNYSKMKIFSFKIFEKHLLQREFIPCKRKSDNTIGLYETQTKQFFINSGSGTLVAGPVLIDDKKINDTKTRVYNTNELTCREMIEI